MSDRHRPGKAWAAAACRPRLLAALLFLAPAAAVHAHPHVFISPHLSLSFDSGTLRGITFEWTFDPMFSTMILKDYDPGRTGRFDTARAEALKRGAFDNLANYHYFLAFWIDGKPLRNLTIEEFAPRVTEEGRLVYRFFVPLRVPLAAGGRTVLVTVYDDSYYVAFDAVRVKDVTVNAGPQVACELSVQKTQVEALWPGQFMPDQLVIRFRKGAP